MSADRIRIRNNPLNAHRTNADRRKYRETMRRFAKLANEAKTNEEFAAVIRERDAVLAALI